MKRVWMSWSSGKDSAWSVHCLRQDPDVELTGLLTTVTASFDRVAMHGVRRTLLERQAAALGLPLHSAEIPSPCPNTVYEERMGALVEKARGEGVTHMAFGDLFLEDVRAYRERMLAGTGIEPLFPLWGRPTGELAHEMIASGLRATLTCVDPRQVDACLAGREFNARLLGDLPAGADPCAENGEFHTFAWAGPMFAEPIRVRSGEVVERDGFVFADLIPG